MCIDDNRCFLVSLCLEKQWARALELLRQGWSAGSVNAQFKVTRAALLCELPSPCPQPRHRRI